MKDKILALYDETWEMMDNSSSREEWECYNGMNDAYLKVLSMLEEKE